MAGYLSDQTTVLSNLSLTGTFTGAGSVTFASGITTSTLTASRISSNVSIVANEVWASGVSTSRLTVQGGVLASGLTLDLRTNLVVLSIDTRANASTMTTGQLRLVFQASGVSLMYSSGMTSYTVGASAVSAAQA